MDWILVASLVLGIAVGIISGLVGVGGGIVLVPALVIIFKMNQHTAQGTSLAMLLPPTGLFAFLQYYRAGHVNVKVAIMVALGVLIGGYFGGQWAQQISGPYLKKIFALVLVAAAVKLFFAK
jgi:hypothetical protein